MENHADKIQESKRQSVANAETQKQGGGDATFQFVDNSPEGIAQRELQEMADNDPEAIAQRELQETADNSPEAIQMKAFQAMADNSPEAKETAQLQAMADNHSAEEEQAIPQQKNNTGLPDKLKAGIENLSGYSMDDVKVHRNSDKPAQLQAHAYAQGTDIHLGPGQEKHLPHEAWHVAQQKEGRVKPTLQMKGNVNVNDDGGLEKEADVMGAKALQLVASGDESKEDKSSVVADPIGQEARQALGFQSLTENRVGYTEKDSYRNTNSIHIKDIQKNKSLEGVEDVFQLSKKKKNRKKTKVPKVGRYFATKKNKLGQLQIKKTKRPKKSSHSNGDGDHVVPILALQHEIINAVQGLTPESALYNLVDTAKKHKELKKYNNSKKGLKEEYDDFIKNNGKTSCNIDDVRSAADELIILRNQIKGTAYPSKKSGSTKGQGESGLTKQLQYWETTLQKGNQLDVAVTKKKVIQELIKYIDYKRLKTLKKNEDNISQSAQQMMNSYPTVVDKLQINVINLGKEMNKKLKKTKL